MWGCSPSFSPLCNIFSHMGNRTQLGCQVAQHWSSVSVCHTPLILSAVISRDECVAVLYLAQCGVCSPFCVFLLLSVNMRWMYVSLIHSLLLCVTAADQWSHFSGQGHVFDSVYGCPSNKHPPSASFLLPCCPLALTPIILPLTFSFAQLSSSLIFSPLFSFMRSLYKDVLPNAIFHLTPTPVIVWKNRLFPLLLFWDEFRECVLVLMLWPNVTLLTDNSLYLLFFSLFHLEPFYEEQ